jgi:hypothetical protein
LEDAGDVYYLQLSIVGFPGHGQAFSEGGDSGSCIFDVDGRIGGIVDGGLASQLGSADITYATPIHWIINDLETRFHSVRLL